MLMQESGMKEKPLNGDGLYDTATQSISSLKRNIQRFPEDFWARLTKEEYENLRCQIDISNSDQNAESGYGGCRYMPFAFAEPGMR